MHLSRNLYLNNKLHLVKGIRGITQSAYLEGHFTNNQTESVNNNVKNWLGRTGNISFAVANSRIVELVTSQQQEFEIFVYGNGSYEMTDSFHTLREKRHLEFNVRRRATKCT